MTAAKETSGVVEAPLAGHVALGFACRPSSTAPDISSREALAGILPPGNPGSNTASDHIWVLDLALPNPHESARPRPGDQGNPRFLVRSDAGGTTHDFAATWRDLGVGYSFGFPITEALRVAVCDLPEECWFPAIDDVEGEIREGAMVAEVTSGWTCRRGPKAPE